MAKGDVSLLKARAHSLTKVVFQGTQERGAALGEKSLARAESLAGQLLVSKKDGSVQAGIDLAGTLRLKSQQVLLQKILDNGDAPLAQRSAALKALTNIDARSHIERAGRLLTSATEPYPLREPYRP